MRIPNFLEKGWGRVKKLWDRLPKLPRRWRIVRNLTLAAALAVLVLELLEWPSLSSYRAFQRLEGAFLLTPSRLVFQVERGKTAGYLSEGDSWIAVGSVSIFDDADKPLNLDRHYAVLRRGGGRVGRSGAGRLRDHGAGPEGRKEPLSGHLYHAESGDLLRPGPAAGGRLVHLSVRPPR